MHRPVTPERLQRRLKRLEPAIRQRLCEAAGFASKDPGVGFLIFEVLPELAFEQFPVSIAMFDVHQERVSEISTMELIDDHPLLDHEFAYPLGRADWLGVDTTQDCKLVFDEIVLFLCQVWQASDLHTTFQNAFASNRLNDEFESGSPRTVVDLSTGGKRHLTFSFQDESPERIGRGW